MESVIRSYLRTDNGDGVLLIVFDSERCVFAIDAHGDVYPPNYWRYEDTFRGKLHYCQFESSTFDE